MAKVCMVGAGGVLETAEYIKNELSEKGKLLPDLKDEVYHIQDGVGVAALVFERYFWGTEGFTSLTVIITGDEDVVYVDGISSGGGGLKEAFCNTENKLLKGLIEVLKNGGFHDLAQEE